MDSRNTAFWGLNPQGLSALVLTCEHASSRLPARLPRDGASRAILRTHWGIDLRAWQIARGLARRLGASAVGARWSRLVIDVNRPVGDPTLILREADGVSLPWNRDLSPAEVERRVMEVHVPYHAEIDRLATRRLVRSVSPFLLAVHTFTPRLGRSRRRFDAGILYIDHGGLARRLGSSLRAEGMSVRYNQPYSGPAGLMYAVDRHGSHHRLPCLEIEVNQDRVATRRGIGRAVAAIARALGPVLRRAQQP